MSDKFSKTTIIISFNRQHVCFAQTHQFRVRSFEMIWIRMIDQMNRWILVKSGLACVAGAWKWWAQEKTGAREGDTRGEREPHPWRVSLARARPFSLSPTTSKRLLRRLRVDSSGHLICHDPSDLGSLILIRIISKESTLWSRRKWREMFEPNTKKSYVQQEQSRNCLNNQLKLFKMQLEAPTGNKIFLVLT